MSCLAVWRGWSSSGLFSSRAERMVRFVLERVAARRELLVAGILDLIEVDWIGIDWNIGLVM